MTRNDLTEVMKLEREVFSNPWSRRMFIQEMDDQFSYVLVEQNEIIGYICGWKIAEEFHITNLAVKQNFRRKGAAVAMVNFIMTKAVEVESDIIFLEVRASNIAALKFYEKMYFTEVGIRKNYYTHPSEDAKILALKIKE